MKEGRRRELKFPGSWWIFIWPRTTLKSVEIQCWNILICWRDSQCQPSESQTGDGECYHGWLYQVLRKEERRGAWRLLSSDHLCSHLVSPHPVSGGVRWEISIRHKPGPVLPTAWPPGRWLVEIRSSWQHHLSSSPAGLHNPLIIIPQ